MKKLLSLILAVIMLLSVMPVAYAAPAEYPPEVEQYIDIWIRVRSYQENIYEEGYEESYTIIHELLRNAEDDFLALGYYTYDYVYSVDAPMYEGYKGYPDMDFISDFNKCIQPAIDEIEAKIACGEIKFAINTYDAYKYWFTFTSHYDLEEAKKIVDTEYFMNNQEYALMYAKADSYDIDFDGETTQVEFDAGWKEYLVPFYDMLMDCLDGNHPYGEYVSNGDATEDADGTKTATCEFCGATDTVVDEGSKIDNSCSCNCHKNGLMGIIWKILKFFYKIFGMNKTCSCGVVHY